jgi:hypothetical protein
MATSTKNTSKSAAVIQQFASWPLFEHVGENLSDKQVKMVASWQEAMECRRKNTFVNLFTMQMNRLWNFAQAQKGQAWFTANWNKDVDKLRAQIEKKFKKLIDGVRRKHKLPVQFEYAVVGDVMSACFIADFPEPQGLPWVQRRTEFYRLGHFPAGWSGRLPASTPTDRNVLPTIDTGKWFVY